MKHEEDTLLDSLLIVTTAIFVLIAVLVML